MINILSINKHELVRLGIEKILQDAGGITFVASLEQAPDVVILEVDKANSAGIEMVRQGVMSYSKTPVLVHTPCSTSLCAACCFEAGAQGYLNNNSAREEYVKAVHALYSKQRYLCVDIANGPSAWEHTHSAPPETNPFDLLGKREQLVARCIIQGLTIPTIAENLGLTTKVVQLYRARTLSKLNLKNDVELTLLAQRYGHLLSPS